MTTDQPQTDKQYFMLVIPDVSGFSGKAAMTKRYTHL